ncbi:MAG: hypothetical protein ABFD16_24485 [Thermoguttaceae bacterium]
MRSHLFRWAILVWAGIWLAFGVEAQAQSTRSNRSPTLINQLDQFGRSLFGIRNKEQPTATANQQPMAARQSTGTAAQAAPQGTVSNGAGMAIETGTSVRMHQSAPRPAAQPNAYTRVAQPSPATTQPTVSAPVSPVAPVASAPAQTSEPAAESVADTTSATPGSMRLHERLNRFRQSAFDDSTNTTADSGTASGDAPMPQAAPQPTPMPTSSAGTSSSSEAFGLRQPFTTSQTTVSAPVSKPATAQPAYTRRYSGTSSEPGVGESDSSLSTSASRTTSTPTLAPRPTPAPSPSAAGLSRFEKRQPTLAPQLGNLSKSASPSPFPPRKSPVNTSNTAPELDEPYDSPTPAPSHDTSASTRNVEVTSPTSTVKGIRPPPPADDAADALFNRQSPVLNVKTLGPRRITVGKESTYELIVRNSGQMGADEVIVTVGLPEWAEVVGVEASTGMTGTGAELHMSKQLTWKIPHLEAKGQEKLVLRLIPRQSKPFDLAVRWDYRPVASEAMIEVQEPKLEMQLDGPREVLFGKREVYRLELANTGTGEAEAVEISLLPIGTGENVPATHRLGTLAAGEKKIIEVELTARQAGVLTIKVDARGDGGVAASLAETIAVLRAALDVTVDASRRQFVGHEARYQLHVVNTGTAPATNVRLGARLPLGTKYLSSTDDGKLAGERGEVTWTIDSLAPGAAKDIDLFCTLERSGSNRLDVSALADGDLAASAVSTMQVEAIADLRLEVVDPSGPVAVGDDATYEVKIRNRGSKSAEEVEVVVYFSRGVEPTAVDGGSHKIAPGQVVFDKIPVLAAGQAMSFKIHAKAEAAGNHVFRAEVYCQPLGTKLVSEETTHYYGSAEGGLRERTMHAGAPSATNDLRTRTADRRPSGTATSAGQGEKTPPSTSRARSSSTTLR